MEQLRNALFEPGLVKTPVIGLIGWVLSWAVLKGVLESVILIGTALIVAIHVCNALARQWCPLRRRKVPDCSNCPLQRTLFCPRGTKEKDDL